MEESRQPIDFNSLLDMFNANSFGGHPIEASLMACFGIYGLRDEDKLYIVYL